MTKQQDTPPTIQKVDLRAQCEIQGQSQYTNTKDGGAGFGRPYGYGLVGFGPEFHTGL